MRLGGKKQSRETVNKTLDTPCRGLDRHIVYDGLFALLNGRSGFYRAYISKDNRENSFRPTPLTEASSSVNFYLCNILIDRSRSEASKLGAY